MNFLQPTYLWTLTAIAIPLAIHLLSRKEGKIVKVGSLRHMEASTTSRFKSLRLNEVWLLLARCLMILWLAMFLSGATCSSSGEKAEWLLTEQGMENDPRVSSLIDSLTEAGFEWRTLANEFPTYDPSRPVVSQPDYRALTEELSQKKDHNIVVMSYNLVDGFKQTRTSLPENVSWIPLDPPSQEFILMASRIRSDSLLLRTATSNSKITTYTNRRTTSATTREWFVSVDGTDSVHLGNNDTIRFAIVHDADHNEDARVLKAAIQATAGIPWIVVNEAEQNSANWIFWLQDAPPDRPFTTRTVIMNPGPNQRWLTHTDKLEWRLNRRINTDNALRDHLTIALARTFASELPAHSADYKKDARSMPDALAWSTDSALVTGGSVPVQDASLWLILLFVVTWATERTLAIRKNL